MSRRHRRTSLWRAGNTFCPICLHEFSFERDIQGPKHGHSATIEHVPQQALQGGRYVTVLTCHSCNKKAGDTFDHAIVDALKGEYGGAIIVDGKRIPIRLSASRHDTKKRTHSESVGHDAMRKGETSNEGPVYMVLSHPATPQEVHIWSESHLLPRIGEEGFQLQWRQRPHPEVGLLKSAYLALYALLGPIYAKDPAVAPVRKQIQEPNSKILTDYTFNVPIRERWICIAYVRPRSCWAVFLDGNLILLPGSGDTEWPNRRFRGDYLQQTDYRRLPDPFGRQYGRLETTEIAINLEISILTS